MLYAQSLPLSSVYSHVLSNIGKTKGHGFEIQIGGVPVRTKNFNWDTTLSVSTAKDEIVELSNGLEKNINGRTGQIVGQPLGVFYLPHCTGLVPDGNVGYKYEIADLNGGGVNLEDGEDRYVAGQAMPKTLLGSNISFRYKRFDVSLQINGAFGHKIYNGTSLTYMNMNIFPDYNVMKKAPQQNLSLIHI